MMTPGTKLGGRYRLDERIAVGGMGEVWRTTDEVLGREVAVKVLLPSLLNEPGFVERFRGEARVVATLTHANIVRVYDYGESPMDGGGHVAYLVMEFVSGEALTKRLQRHGRLTPAEALPLMAQAAEALHAAHVAGVIHRDVKPGNLLIAQNDTVMLTDFGIARSALTGGLTQAGSVLGTAAYVSPEQASGHGVTAQSDVYSLGIVTYQALAGRRPFDSDNPVELAMRHVNDMPPPLPDDVPEATRAFAARALAKDPAQRFTTAAEMAAAARTALDGAAPATDATPNGGDGFAQGTAAPPPGRSLDGDFTSVAPAADPQTPPPQRRGNVGLLVIAGLALTAVLGAGLVWAVVNSSSDTGSQVDGGSDEEASQTDSDDDSAEIVSEDYLDESPDEVKEALEELGFTDVSLEGNGNFVHSVSPDGVQDLDEPIVVTAGLQRGGGGGGDDDTGPGEQSPTPDDGECSVGGDVANCTGG